ncbi:MAG TPA: mechanosensitive ion channel domain-containing protein [Desulfuromonadales bacterium]|nr:mechanosensitive ion channel domain-containing protein [Desulfuromonadales bacterium]
MDSQNLWDNINYYFKEFVLFKIQDVGITISHLAVAVIAILLSLLMSKLVRSTLQKQLFKKIEIDQGLEYALLRFIHYVILVVGVYIGLKSINIPLGALIGLFAVIGVGIGFGLQNLASNFISGLILLFERPVKIGDRLELNDVWGDVRQINLRTTLIETPDKISIILPNSRLLENEVINYSYGDPMIRLRIPVGIAYGSDCEKAADLLVQVALDNDRVLNDPKPKTWFREFGDSSLNFVLLCWIPNAANKYDITSELNHGIDRIFRENGVEIPFPQRDLHLRSARDILRFQEEKGD